MQARVSSEKVLGKRGGSYSAKVCSVRAPDNVSMELLSAFSEEAELTRDSAIHTGLVLTSLNP